MIKDSYLRSIIKALSWRISGFLITTIIVLILSNQWKLALTVGMLETVFKIFLYITHDKLWEKIKYGRRSYNPMVIWFSGLSGSGKTTLGEALLIKLKKRGLKVEILDGDNIRQLFPSTGYEKNERIEHIKRVGHLASRLEKAGVVVIGSLISPYEEARHFVRSNCTNFIEIYLSTPLEVCEKRDPKGLYAKARKGEIKNFTGISDPYEIPKKPEIEINTDKLSIDQALVIIEKYLNLKF
jgi:adenylylsulfate kinase